MKNANLFLGIAATAMVFLSCKKDGSTDPKDVSKIKTETYYNSDGTVSDITNYEYNSDNKLVKTIYDDNSYDVIEYSGSTVALKSYSSTGTLDATSSDVYTLDSKGLASSEVYSYTKKSAKCHKSFLNKSLNAGTTNATFKYNSDGYLTEEKYTSTSRVSTYTYTISGGNTEKCVYLYIPTSGSSSTDSDIFEYYTDKTNTIGYHNFGIYFLGTDNVNLLKKDTYTYNSSTSIYSKEYEYDSKGRVSKRINKNNSGTVSSWAVFTYVD
jgi:hypothetical protein